MPFPKVSILERDCILYTVNPLSPKSDEHQFCPKNINKQSREKVVRIYKEIITLEEQML